MTTFAVRVYGLPVEKFDSRTISLSRIAVTKKLRSEQGFIQRSVDPEFIAMKKSVVAKLQKIRKDLKRVERHYTKRF